MANDVFTLITYVESEMSWIDRCGDFQEGESSFHEVISFSDVESVANHWAKQMLKFEKRNCEVTLLINGYDFNSMSKGDVDNELFEKLESIFFDIDNMQFEIYQKLKEEKRKELELAAEKKKQEQELARLRAKKAEEDAERAQLAKLLNKYGK